MKSKPDYRPNAQHVVTLRVRVWIEIDLQVVVPCGKCVTLRVRVWIEIVGASPSEAMYGESPSV